MKIYRGSLEKDAKIDRAMWTDDGELLRQNLQYCQCRQTRSVGRSLPCQIEHNSPYATLPNQFVARRYRVVQKKRSEGSFEQKADGIGFLNNLGLMVDWAAF